MGALYFAIGLRMPYPDGYLFQLKVAYYLPPFLGDKLRAVITNNLGPLARHALQDWGHRFCELLGKHQRSYLLLDNVMPVAI